jgi:hypothetical protein
MTGKDLITVLKSRAEWGAYFTSEGYDFVSDLKSAREIYIALRAWGVSDASERDSAQVLVDKLDQSLRGSAKSLLSRTGFPGFHL